MNYKKTGFCLKFIIFALLFPYDLCMGTKLPYHLENLPFIFFSSESRSSRILTSLLFDEQNQKSAVIISNDLFKVIYSIEDEPLKKVQTEDGEFYFVNGFFPNCVYKDNIIPLIYDEFFIKLVKMLGDINFKGTITDMFRTNEQQISYYKRRWTNNVVSPHMIGLAIDLNNLTLTQEIHLKSFVNTFSISFLKHGRKYNRHVHLQDNSTWGKFKGNDISVICKEIFQKLVSTPELYRSIPQEIVEPPKSNFSVFCLEFESPGILTIDILRLDGIKVATIKSGIFEPGYHQLQLYYNFLPSGIYLGRLFINGIFYYEIVIKAI